jgi:hypothetical protein
VSGCCRSSTTSARKKAFRNSLLIDAGKERLVIEEQVVGDGQRSIGRIGAVGARQGVVEADTMAYKDGKPGGFDRHKRIPDMDADGIDAAFLYPSLPTASPRRAESDAGSPRRRVAGDKTSGHGRWRDGLLRPRLRTKVSLALPAKRVVA